MRGMHTHASDGANGGRGCVAGRGLDGVRVVDGGANFEQRHLVVLAEQPTLLLIVECWHQEHTAVIGLHIHYTVRGWIFFKRTIVIAPQQQL